MVLFAITYCVNCWWVQHRGFAMGIMNSMATVLFALAAVETALIEEYGWRYVTMSMGIETGCMLAIASCAMPQPSTRTIANQEQCLSESVHAGTPKQADGLSLEQARRTPMFSLMVLLQLNVEIPWSGLNFLLDELLTEAGHEQKDAVYVYASMAALIGISGIFTGLGIDHLASSSKHLSLLFSNGTCFLAVVTACLLPVFPPTAGLVLFGSSMGALAGTNGAVMGAVVANVFGERCLGEVAAFFAMVSHFTSACGPLVFSLALTSGIPFRTILMACLVCNAVGMALVPLFSMPNLRSGDSVPPHSSKKS